MYSANCNTIQLDAKGVATLNAADIDNGSFDNTTGAKNLIFTLSQTNFSCADLGTNLVTLSVADEAGNISEASANVTVEDLIPPVASAVRTLSYDLANGPVTISLADIEDGSTDNCGITNLSLNETGGDFLLPGTYFVTLTATDQAGNENTSETEVVITDSSLQTADISFGKLKLTVFPVPFNEVINIAFSEPTDLNTVSVQLLDFNQVDTGIQFHINGPNLISDDVSGLNIGNNIYWLVVTISGKKTQTQAIDIIKN